MRDDGRTNYFADIVSVLVDVLQSNGFARRSAATPNDFVLRTSSDTVAQISLKLGKDTKAELYSIVFEFCVGFFSLQDFLLHAGIGPPAKPAKFPCQLWSTSGNLEPDGGYRSWLISKSNAGEVKEEVVSELRDRIMPFCLNVVSLRGALVACEKYPNAFLALDNKVPAIHWLLGDHEVAIAEARGFFREWERRAELNPQRGVRRRLEQYRSFVQYLEGLRDGVP